MLVIIPAKVIEKHLKSDLPKEPVIFIETNIVNNDIVQHDDYNSIKGRYNTTSGDLILFVPAGLAFKLSFGDIDDPDREVGEFTFIASLNDCIVFGDVEDLPKSFTERTFAQNFSRIVDCADEKDIQQWIHSFGSQ